MAAATKSLSRISSLSLLRHLFSPTREFCNTPKRNPKLVNFSLPDSDSEDEPNPAPRVIDKTKLPPPYDPFGKKAVLEDPGDPKNLQEVFHRIRTDGLFDNAVKMFDGLSKDGLTHEALELFGEIKDKGHMPDVVAHTAVIEAYVNANQPKDALKVFLRMLAGGVLPNAYTYGVLIKGLARDGKMLGEAKQYVVEMMGKGMRPNAETCVAVIEGFVREGKAEEGQQLVAELKERSFLPEKKAVREILKDKRGPLPRGVMDILFGM